MRGDYAPPPLVVRYGQRGERGTTVSCGNEGGSRDGKGDDTGGNGYGDLARERGVCVFIVILMYDHGKEQPAIQ